VSDNLGVFCEQGVTAVRNGEMAGRVIPGCDASREGRSRWGLLGDGTETAYAVTVTG
jgi:hypothetical protein